MTQCCCKFLIGVVALAGNVVGAGAEDSPKDQESLRLSLWLDSRRILPYEPVCGTAFLENVSSEPLKMTKARAAVFNNLQFACAHQQGPFVVSAHGSEIAADVFGRDWVLPPGEAVTEYEVLLLRYDSNRRRGESKFIFGKPGQYRVKAVLSYEGKRMESGVVELEVGTLPPEYEVALPLITDTRGARMLQGWEYTSEGVEALQGVIQVLPQTIYADQARYKLSRYWQTSSEMRRRADPESARRTAIKAYCTAWSVSPRNRYLRARALIRAGEIVVECGLGREVANTPELQRELKERSGELNSVGLSQRGAELQEDLTGLLKDRGGEQ